LDLEIVKVVKAASMVEYNGTDYATYLCNVFPDDPDFQEVAKIWAAEEVQHGSALGRWAELADPSFDFARSFERFTRGFSLPLEAKESVRGSRAFRHYKLFYTHMQRYLEIERISKLRRALVALGRIGESHDDELAYAYYAANSAEDERYERKRSSRAYETRIFSYFQPLHVERGVAMTFKVAGLSPKSQLARWTTRGVYWLMRSRQKRFARAGF
jgi:hypothetical protein